MLYDSVRTGGCQQIFTDAKFYSLFCYHRLLLCCRYVRNMLAMIGENDDAVEYNISRLTEQAVVCFLCLLLVLCGGVWMEECCL
jgi:hypothetical protein